MPDEQPLGVTVMTSVQRNHDIPIKNRLESLPAINRRNAPTGQMTVSYALAPAVHSESAPPASASAVVVLPPPPPPVAVIQATARTAVASAAEAEERASYRVIPHRPGQDCKN
ncbi:unnamed protein product [Heligmosomoides polygyrus]|uniref:Uncharacterized protein n=1 Tax=Heligmosomoides polygyrus TaxID=6339 RepID=A0A183G2N0_HELPZ|nr:unnamed protein product [Heligmosomoides polygyrus]